MSIIFKFNRDGKHVLVARSFFGKMEEREFKAKAKKVSVEAFTEKLSGSKKEKFEEVAKRLQELDAMKITMMGHFTTSNPCTRTTTTRYCLGGKTFVWQSGDEAKIDEYHDAMKYGNEFYGEEFMEEYFPKSLKKDIYFIGTKEVSEKEYNVYEKEIEALTGMVSLNKIKNVDEAAKR